LKKILLTCLLAILLLILTSCGEVQTEPVSIEESNKESGTIPNQQNADDKEVVNEEQSTQLSIDEFINNVVKAVESVESFSSEMTISAEGEEAQKMGTFEIKGTTETIINPYRSHMIMNIQGLVDSGNQINMDIESYTVEGVTFTSNSMLSGWMQMEEEENNLPSMNPNNQLEVLQELKDQFELSDTSDEYILSTTGDGEKLKKFFSEWSENAMPDMESNQDSQNDDILVGTLKFIFDKSTFLSKEVWVEMTIQNQESGMETTMKIHTVTNNYNAIKDIVIPDAVKESTKSGIQIPNMGDGDLEITPEMQKELEEMMKTLQLEEAN